MKLIPVLCLCTFLLAAGERPQPPKPLEIPPAAVESAPGVFQYTDQQGAKWTYYKTPFGVSRAQDMPRAAAPLPTNIKAIEDGDSVRFERPGPFGIYRWQHKKSELDEMERAVLLRQQNASGSRQDRF